MNTTSSSHMGIGTPAPATRVTRAAIRVAQGGEMASVWRFDWRGCESKRSETRGLVSRTTLFLTLCAGKSLHSAAQQQQ